MVVVTCTYDITKYWLGFHKLNVGMVGQFHPGVYIVVRGKVAHVTDIAWQSMPYARGAQPMPYGTQLPHCMYYISSLVSYDYKCNTLLQDTHLHEFGSF